MDKLKIKALYELLHSAQDVAIVVHTNPDGDALGSALALCEYAKNEKINATVISPNRIGENLKWLPHTRQILEFEEVSNKHKKRLAQFDTAIFLDHSSQGRSENVPNYFTMPTERRAFIDHHPSPNFEVGIAILDTNSAATCCMLFDVLMAMNAKITRKIADCLYTGIVTDTGNFRYGNGIAQVFRIASKLIQFGANKDKITQNIYNTNTENRMRLLGFVLQEKMQRVGENSAYITISQKELEKFGATYRDTEDFVNQPLTIKNIFISAIFIEKDDFIKISFRSRGKFDVNLLARNHFNGGGHKNAAGGKFFGTLEDAVALYSKYID